MTPAELRRVAFDFRLARAVSCALELGVFEALAKGTTDLACIASRCGLDPRGARILLGALVAGGLLERDPRAPRGYRLVDALRESLLEDGGDFQGNLLLHDLWHWSAWARLDRAVRSGAAADPSDGDAHLGDPEVLRRFLPNYVRAMEQSVGESPGIVAGLLAPLAPRNVLDLAGGTGGHLVALLRELPGARGTLAEMGFSLDAARERVRQSGLASRIEVREFDFEADEIPRGHDLILISRVLMGLDPERARRLVRRCAEALAPGGTLAVHDYDPDTRVGSLLSLDMLLNTGGEAHPLYELRSWIDQAGLECAPTRSVLPYTYLCLATKPGGSA